MNYFKFYIFTCAVLFFAIALPLYAAQLININTADQATLETLSGIGPVKSQAIIDYRTANGPFAKIADIQNVSGIGAVTFANIENFITVDAASEQSGVSSSTTQTQDQTQAQDASPDVAQASTTQAQDADDSSGVSSVPAITAAIDTDALSFAGGGSYFAGSAYGLQGMPLDGARFIWNFGDGATAEGQRVFHAYEYPGTYDVALTVASGASETMVRATVQAIPPALQLLAEGDGSVTVVNASPQTLDVGLWQLACGSTTFTIPQDTAILAGGGVRFSPLITHFPIDAGATIAAKLLYPDGVLAAEASAAPDSPLRGEAVSVQNVQAMLSAPAAQQTRAAPLTPAAPVQQTDPPATSASSSTATLGAAAAFTTVSTPLAAGAVGLMALVGLSAGGVYYVRVTKKRDDEFDIE
jgi:competence protein ComEA